MFNLATFDVKKFDNILARGLSHGLGTQGQSVCIEAAICETLGLPHGDDPGCVSVAVRSFKIQLNDSKWSSPQARANGLRELGIAQLGSKGVVDDIEFSKKIAEKTIRVLIPALFREIFPNDKKLLEAADRCEQDGTEESANAAAYAAACAAYAAADAATAADAADAAAAAARAARAANADAATAADAAYAACGSDDKYLLLSAKLALGVLIELKSPGASLL